MQQYQAEMEKEERRAPKITRFKWGEIEVQSNRKYKDAKLYPGGAREWDWNETGTHHTPGIQPADLKELLDHNVEVIVLSKGINERLDTAPETLALLEQNEISYFVLQSGEAVKKYNELRKTRRVGALIHSTC